MIGLQQRGNRRVEPVAVAPAGRTRAIAGVLIAAGFALALGAGLRELFDPATLPIREVRIDGDFRHLAPVELQRIVAAEVTAGFFRVDVGAIRAALLGQPWVDTVAVRRMWPDALQIDVVEQRPIAYWGADGLMNERGIVFRPAPASFPAGLPRLAGPAGTETTVLAHYREAVAILASRELGLAGVSLSERRAWQLQIAGGPLVVVGRGEFSARLTRFVTVLDAVAGDAASSLAIVDLRYTNGLAVRPRPATAAVSSRDRS